LAIVDPHRDLRDVNAHEVATQGLEAAKAAFVKGDFDGAERLCRSLIAAAPALAGPWIILGDIELRRRRPDTALVWADKAIAIEPANAFGYLVRCKSLVAASRLLEAFQSAERAIAIGDCPPAALDEFGMVFSQLGRYGQALACFRRAVAGDSSVVKFLFNLAVAERTAGEMEAAERHCDAVIARNPRFHDAYFIRADLRKQTAERNHVAQMEALLAAGIDKPEGEILVRFALGKECEDLGDHAAAFRHIDAGAKLKRQSLRYDIRGNLAVMDRLIRGQTREVLDAAAATAVPGDATRDDPIFIVGLPRSGTTLVERIVTSHSIVVAAGELSTLPNELTRVARAAGITRGGDWVEKLPAIDLAAMGRAYSRVAREIGIPDDKRLTDKYPANYLYCGAIRAAFPNARIIVLRRRPMDSCYALYKQLFAENVYPFSYSLDELAQYYAGFHRLIRHWRDAIPAAQLMELSYEDLVADLEGQSRRMIRFLGLPWEDGVLRFHEREGPVSTASAAQVRQPIYASSIGKWRNYAEQLEPLRTRLAELMPGEDLG
jgi:tetratricopeptide (TPR) repeat protein